MDTTNITAALRTKTTQHKRTHSTHNAHSGTFLCHVLCPAILFASTLAAIAVVSVAGAVQTESTAPL